MPQLSPTSYVVLGLLMAYGPTTSYELKKRAAATVGNFWIFAHSQLYDEPVRLARQGLVTEETEAAGRRRRTYHVTPAGEAAMRDWLGSPTHGKTEVRDPGLLKLFFGGLGSPRDMRALARDQQQAHSRRAQELEDMQAGIDGIADLWQSEALALGIHFERTVEAYWRDFLSRLTEEGS